MSFTCEITYDIFVRGIIKRYNLERMYLFGLNLKVRLSDTVVLSDVHDLVARVTR